MVLLLFMILTQFTIIVTSSLSVSGGKVVKDGKIVFNGPAASSKHQKWCLHPHQVLLINLMMLSIK